MVPKTKLRKKNKGFFKISVPTKKENAADDSPLIQEQFFSH